MSRRARRKSDPERIVQGRTPVDGKGQPGQTVPAQLYELIKEEGDCESFIPLVFKLIGKVRRRYQRPREKQPLLAAKTSSNEMTRNAYDDDDDVDYTYYGSGKHGKCRKPKDGSAGPSSENAKKQQSYKAAEKKPRVWVLALKADTLEQKLAREQKPARK